MTEVQTLSPRYGVAGGNAFVSFFLSLAPLRLVGAEVDVSSYKIADNYLFTAKARPV